MGEIHPDTNADARAKRPWEPPCITRLRRLTDLTLATGDPPGVAEGPGFLPGPSTVIP